MNVNSGSGAEASQQAERAEFGPRKRTGSSRKAPKAKTEASRKESKPLPPWAEELRDWGRTLAIAVIVVFCMHYFVFNLSTVEGQSMEPTLYEKEWLFVNKISYMVGTPELSDVVILKDPSQEAERKEFLVKRIVGMPGDTIEIRQGQLYRNGELVVEPYTDTDIEDLDYGPDKIAAGHYFVMGDNRHQNASRDSRSFHSVPRELIMGRADFILWPIAKLNDL
ncbi:signal peptidase I [Paenibacillus montanisoli]|uniref:Signal peptidase I n=1 Tax=Paenibacillus montanisoli TaxID=2081970 RepID=A0A328U388_9BACL|nr:signal peptidase I [Paenibacillus montanisoli]RAP74444.1 signal peptidase I [Paenibacillus montanisoli]